MRNQFQMIEDAEYDYNMPIGSANYSCHLNCVIQ